MSGTFKASNGKQVRIVTPEEFEALNRGRAPYQTPWVAVDPNTTIDTVFENNQGEIVREPTMPSENVRRRAEMGEPSVVATPEKIELARKADQARWLAATADEHNLAAFANEAVPGMQFLQNAMVGKDAATEARRSLYGNNRGWSFAGNLAEFALGSRLIGMGAEGLLGAERAAALGTRLGFSKESSAIARTGRVALENVAADTHFYVQNALNTGDPFSAEEWARQVGVGMVIGSPLILGTAVRGAAQAAVRAVGQSDMLGMLRTGLYMGAAAAPAGSIKAAQRLRGGVIVGLANKLFRRFRKPGLGVSAEEAARAEALYAQLDTLRVRAEAVDGMKNAAKRTQYLEDFKAAAAEDARFVDDIPWGTLQSRVNKMNSNTATIRNEARSVFKKLEGSGRHKTWESPITMSEAQRNRVLVVANEVMNHTSDVGMAEVAGTIKRKVLTGNASPESLRKALIEAGMDAKLRRGVSGGAAEVDDLISGVLRDQKVWGKRVAGSNSRALDAMNEVRQTWDELGQVHARKGLGDLGIEDGVRLQGKHAQVARMRKAINGLAEEGMLSERQVTAMSDKFTKAEDSIASGAEAYKDAIKFNSARSAAEAKLAKDFELAGEIPETLEDFIATKLNATAGIAGEVAEFTGKALDMILSTKPLAIASRGVGALHGFTEQEKYDLFEHIQGSLLKYSGNPTALIEDMGERLDRGATWDPGGADLAAAKTVNAIYYLASQMPRTDDTLYGRHVPQPLSGVEEFLEKYVAAYDPVSVAWAALRGEATPQMIDAVRVTNPKTYAELQLKIVEALARADAEKANPNAVAGASLFLGGMDPMYNGAFILQLQSTYAQTQTQDQVINGPRPAGNVRNRGPELSVTQRQQTNGY